MIYSSLLKTYIVNLYFCCESYSYLYLNDNFLLFSYLNSGRPYFVGETCPD